MSLLYQRIFPFSIGRLCNHWTNQRSRCKQRGIKLAALQSSGVFDPRGSRQISMQAWLLGSLLTEINAHKKRTSLIFTNKVLL